MARPTKYNTDRAGRILAALRAGNTRSAAAHAGGIDMGTLARWEKRFSDFAGYVRDAESAAERMMVGHIRQAALSDWRAAAFWLERRRSEDWGRKDRLEVTSLVRLMAAEAGLDEQETNEAVAEAERYLENLGASRSR